MMIAIAVTEQQRALLILKGIPASATIKWVANTAELLQANAGALIDCTFCSNQLPQTDVPFLFHSPVNTLAGLHANRKTGRFCAWNTFLERKLWDIAITNNGDDTWVNILKSELEWDFCVVKDMPGLVAPRMVCSVINEARYALQARISSRHEIDLAMKLGTNYPYGPFEWADKIGNHHIDVLLTKLAEEQSFYQPVIANII